MAAKRAGWAFHGIMTFKHGLHVGRSLRITLPSRWSVVQREAVDQAYHAKRLREG
jgi:hypothetical protein